MNANIERSPYVIENDLPQSVQQWAGRADQEWSKLDERRKERVRIARELHDTLFQGFLGAFLQIQDVADLPPEDSADKPPRNNALRLMRRVIDEGRDVLRGLRLVRVASTSLEQALTSLRDEIAPGSRTRFRVFVKGQPKEMTRAVQEQLYMIGREALVNALRHSEASSIEAEVEYSRRELRVSVRDNGRGIHPGVLRSGREAHWGLVGMCERAATIGARLRIWSRPGSGTEVEISVPEARVAGACA